MIDITTYITIAVMTIIIGIGVFLLLVFKLEMKNFNLEILVILTPLIIMGIIIVSLGALLLDETNKDQQNEQQQLLGMGCKQLKQFLEDAITEKIQAYDDSKDMATQLLLTRCS